MDDNEFNLDVIKNHLKYFASNELQIFRLEMWYSDQTDIQLNTKMIHQAWRYARLTMLLKQH